jgi:hypothetical protein
VLDTQPNSFVVLCRLDEPGSWTARLTIHVRDAMGSWHTGGTADLGMLLRDDVAPRPRVTMSSGVAAIANVTKVNTNAEGIPESFDYQVLLVTWDASFEKLTVAAREEPTAVPIGLLPAIKPTIVENTMVVTGSSAFRFDGDAWRFYDMGVEVPGDPVDPRATFYWYAYAPDALLATENGPDKIVSRLLGFDPDSTASPWYLQTVHSQDHPDPIRFRQLFPNASGNHLALGKTIYRRKLASRWSSPLSGDAIGELPAGPRLEIDTVTTIDHSPRFLAYLTLDPLTQAPVATRTLLFKDGLLRTEDGAPVTPSMPSRHAPRLPMGRSGSSAAGGRTRSARTTRSTRSRAPCASSTTW